MEKEAVAEEEPLAEDQPLELKHITDIENPALVNVPVTVECVVSSASESFFVPAKIEATVEKYIDNILTEIESTQIIEKNDPVNISLFTISETQKTRK